NGSRFMPTFDGVDVRLDESAYWTVTDDKGNWQFSNVPVGGHTIVFSKPGFGTTRLFADSLQRGGSTLYRTLGREPLETVHLNDPPVRIDTPFSLTPFYRLSGSITSPFDFDLFVDLDSTVQPASPHLHVYKTI